MEGEEESSLLEIGNNTKINRCNFIRLKISVQKETTSFFKKVGISESITLYFENLVFFECESDFFYRGSGSEKLQLNSVYLYKCDISYPITNVASKSGQLINVEKETRILINQFETPKFNCQLIYEAVQSGFKCSTEEEKKGKFSLTDIALIEVVPIVVIILIIVGVFLICHFFSKKNNLNDLETSNEINV
jgi:hypothetical protein